MQDRIPIHNTSTRPMYVGSTLIPAGETKLFLLQDLPPHLRPGAVEASAPADANASAPEGDLQAQLDKIEAERASAAEQDEARRVAADAEAAERAAAAAEASAKLLAEIADANAKAVVAAVPQLTDEDLVRLEARETGRKDDGDPGTQPRRTVLEAIAEETLRRAGEGA